MIVPYEEWPAVNWSTLKWMKESPLHYQHALGHPRTDTASLAFGRAAHVLSLQPETFDAHFVVWEGDRRTKAWKEFKASESRTILRPSELDRAQAIAARVRSYAPIQPYLVGADVEVPLYWQDPESGLPCKGRLDLLHRPTQTLIDLKTCRSTHMRRFGNAAAAYGYHTQLAHYAAGVEAVLKWHPRRVAILAVESEPPHDIVLYDLDPEGPLMWGQQERHELLAQVAECMATGLWPGRYATPQPLELPSWADPDDDVDLDLLDLEAS